MAEKTNARYHCPMHPTYVSDKPGDCPICGMRLVLKEPDAPDASGAPAAAVDSDHAVVTMDPAREQLMGVRAAAAERRPLIRVIRASGRVAYDPELYNAVSDYREALKTSRSGGGRALAESAALRLRQLGLSPAQVRGLAEPSRDLTNLLTGGQDGGAVWVYAQVYEHEAGLVKPGHLLEALSSAYPGRVFRGKVAAVDAILNPETRTLKVRAEVPNPDGALRPEMFVDVRVHVDLGRLLSVPEEAVMDTGVRQLVFVRTGPGRYEPREVRAGREAEGYVEILEGLKEGEAVAASGNFLIDSESRLKAALSGSEAHQH